VVKTSIYLAIELNPQKSLTVTDSYNAIREFCGKDGLLPWWVTLSGRNMDWG
jgi:hypothetical protein